MSDNIEGPLQEGPYRTAYTKPEVWEDPTSLIVLSEVVFIQNLGKFSCAIFLKSGTRVDLTWADDNERRNTWARSLMEAVKEHRRR
jgi:hypothetical protein